MRLARNDRWRIGGFGLLLVLAIGIPPAYGLPPANLSTPGNSFSTDSHYVSTTVFTWYNTDINGNQTGQHNGPWRPTEGINNWTGRPDWWQSQVKQMMAANIDTLQVLLYSQPVGDGNNQLRTNLFQALHDLRMQGYNVPKVAPFLDTVITTYAGGWTPSTPGQPVDVGTTAGKNTFTQQYTDFYNQYYSANTDANADSYIMQLDGRVVLDTYWLRDDQDMQTVRNVSSLSRNDVQSRLTSSLGGQHALFRNLPSNGIFMINSRNGEHMSFADEVLAQFEGTWYYQRDSQGGRNAAHVLPGFCNQNVVSPGYFAPRNGGVEYENAWSSVQYDKYFNALKHVNVESWNEYDEGSGIYAADAGPPYIAPSNQSGNTDVYSDTNDPYEYIKTTAEGARLFNDTPNRDASILWHNLPATMRPGQTGTYQVIVRNDGDLSWRGADNFKFGEEESKDVVMFGPERYLIDDASNEIPLYGGIFRGRPITFNVELTAPMDLGEYATHWQMVQDGVAWFGDELVMQITVAAPEPSSAALACIGLLSVGVYVCRKRRRFSSSDKKVFAP